MSDSQLGLAYSNLAKERDVSFLRILALTLLVLIVRSPDGREL